MNGHDTGKLVKTNSCISRVLCSPAPLPSDLYLTSRCSLTHGTIIKEPYFIHQSDNSSPKDQLVRVLISPDNITSRRPLK